MAYTRRKKFFRQPWYKYTGERTTLREILRVMSYQDKYYIRRAIPQAVYRNRQVQKTKRRATWDAGRPPYYWKRHVNVLFVIDKAIEVHIPVQGNKVIICVDDVFNRYCKTRHMVAFYRALVHMSDYHDDMEFSGLHCVYTGDDPVGFVLTFYSFLRYPPDDVYAEHERNITNVLRFQGYYNFYHHLSLTYNVSPVHGIEMMSEFGQIIFNDKLALPVMRDEIHTIRFINALPQMERYHDFDWSMARIKKKGKIYPIVDGSDLVINCDDTRYLDMSPYVLVSRMFMPFYQRVFLLSKNYSDVRKNSPITPDFYDIMLDDMEGRIGGLPVFNGQDVKSDSVSGVMYGVWGGEDHPW